MSSRKFGHIDWPQFSTDPMEVADLVQLRLHTSALLGMRVGPAHTCPPDCIESTLEDELMTKRLPLNAESGLSDKSGQMGASQQSLGRDPTCDHIMVFISETEAPGLRKRCMSKRDIE
jgi:hypothetical protein